MRAPSPKMLDGASPRFGEVLDNGFVLLAHVFGVVLARKGGKYVTWVLTPEGYTVHGRYFDPRSFGGDQASAREAAWQSYASRSREEGPGTYL